MAHFGITANARGLAVAADPGRDLETELRARLVELPAGAAIVVFVHGYRFDPATPQADPHRSLFATEPGRDDPRVRSWPRGLGFVGDCGNSGLSLGFGWPAVEGGLPVLLRTGRNGFAHVYDRAGEYGPKLAELIALAQRLAPGRPVDILAHSVGARVALSALPHLEQAPGRVILLGAAEFDSTAMAFLAASPAARPARIYNVTARANDFYDAAFETFAPRRNWQDRAVGLGLGAPVPHWIDLQIDRADVTAWINARGIPLRPSEARFCHWSFYTRDGAFGVYQAILRRQSGWDIPSLRAQPCLSVQEPRWSRVIPRLGWTPDLGEPAEMPAGFESA